MGTRFVPNGKVIHSCARGYFSRIQCQTTSLESMKQVAKDEGFEGWKFVSKFLLDIFDN
jgi:hypothetical protein